MKKVTIRDVAKKVGVSTSAVSYVINGVEGKVSKEKADLIQSAIKELNFVPNMSAATLVNKKSKLIGVIIPQTEGSHRPILENPFYSEIVSGIEAKARELGYHILLSGADMGKTYLNITMQRNLDAAIIMGIYKEEFYADLKKVNIPIVLIDSYINDPYFCKIGVDDEYGGYLATKYLIERGHKNIALVTGTIREDGVVEKRFLGYKRALKESNLFYNSSYVLESSVSYKTGLESGRFIAKELTDVTAVFATADLIAFGLIKGIMESGKRVPDDISVIGFDDIFVSEIFIPPLTTIKQSITQKGVMAVQMLINLIEGKKNTEKEIILPVNVVERETVKSLEEPQQIN